jgi:ribosomal protein L11 methylase PrmA
MEKIIFLIFVIFTFLFLIFIFPIFLGFGPFLPSKKQVILKALKLANLKENECLFDLGCGWGNVLFVAQKYFGAKVVGFEISPVLFLLAKLNLLLNRVKGKIYWQDFFKADLKEADVIFLYLTPPILKKLEEKLKKELMGSKKRVVTVSSPLPSIKPEKTVSVFQKENWLKIYLYIF